MMLNKKIIKFVLKLLVSLLFVAWLVLKTNWAEVWVYAKLLSLSEIALYLLIIVAGMFISARKWQILLASKNMHFSVSKLFSLYLTGTFINNFMPSTIGGDTYRAFQVGKRQTNYAQAATTVVMDRLTGFFGTMVLVLFFSVLNRAEVAQRPLLFLLAGGIFVGLVALFLLEKILHWNFLQKVSGKIPQKIKEFVRALHAYYKHKKLFASAMAFSMFFAFVGVALANFVLFWALGIEVGILNYLTVIFLISIVSALPVSVNNIGIKEWAYVTFFGFFGVASSAVVAVALISRILQMFLSFLALPFYLKGQRALRD